MVFILIVMAVTILIISVDIRVHCPSKTNLAFVIVDSRVHVFCSGSNNNYYKKESEVWKERDRERAKNR